MVLRVRVVLSPPSEMPTGLSGMASAVLIFFQAGSSAAALFPRIFFDIGDGLFDEVLTAPSSGYGGGWASTPFGQSPLGMIKKYTALSCEWIFAYVDQFTARLQSWIQSSMSKTIVKVT